MDPNSVPSVDRVPHGGHAAETVEFSANVNPEVPPGVEDVYRDAFGAVGEYPPEPPTDYVAAAAEYVDVDPAHVIPTAGGLAALRLAIETTVETGDTALVPAPSFGEYAREVRLQGATAVPVPESEILDADPDDHALAVVCNPNNPTGRAYDRGDLLAFVRRSRAAGTPVIVDEAFLGFTDRETLAGTDGAIVARSLTKLFGLPGLRAGFAVATGKLGERLRRARRPWNLGTPARLVGAYCMQQTDFVGATRDRVERERERMADVLNERYEVFPSAAPFLLLEVTGESVDAVVERCERRGLTIRDARTFATLENHVRVAIRRPAENRRLEEALLDV
ncbi:aminotransferase class I/II-fold pyridoxal phosphate-dependent enzyme [Halanaeroarchaeum sulfurireducens]|uniref:Aminotransferase n=1 Tax=Halanaeroarchaeum sulfurireducens TaxID=1604004 RepID=A0A0F7P6L4_9EURY|nr:aminotransferase class I/II-fold pyridoxal phosphate-dependent enzyme [Halanaeroarchaeum sulfurireducens]AKH96806.1 L-threonine-O-3-phosphate decarboxylase [Halanaeroarchaeum sulfurireducens]ALG81208.1 L-threonine-O-3-phosphate decarboxylase [Halanaeroarchaeum sulfurireducens]